MEATGGVVGDAPRERSPIDVANQFSVVSENSIGSSEDLAKQLKEKDLLIAQLQRKVIDLERKNKIYCTVSSSSEVTIDGTAYGKDNGATMFFGTNSLLGNQRSHNAFSGAYSDDSAEEDDDECLQRTLGPSLHTQSRNIIYSQNSDNTAQSTSRITNKPLYSIDETVTAPCESSVSASMVDFHFTAQPHNTTTTVPVPSPVNTTFTNNASANSSAYTPGTAGLSTGLVRIKEEQPETRQTPQAPLQQPMDDGASNDSASLESSSDHEDLSTAQKQDKAIKETLHKDPAPVVVKSEFKQSVQQPQKVKVPVHRILTHEALYGSGTAPPQVYSSSRASPSLLNAGHPLSQAIPQADSSHSSSNVAGDSTATSQTPFYPSAAVAKRDGELERRSPSGGSGGRGPGNTSNNNRTIQHDLIPSNEEQAIFNSNSNSNSNNNSSATKKPAAVRRVASSDESPPHRRESGKRTIKRVDKDYSAITATEDKTGYYKRVKLDRRFLEGTSSSGEDESDSDGSRSDSQDSVYSGDDDDEDMETYISRTNRNKVVMPRTSAFPHRPPPQRHRSSSSKTPSKSTSSAAKSSAQKTLAQKTPAQKTVASKSPKQPHQQSGPLMTEEMQNKITNKHIASSEFSATFRTHLETIRSTHSINRAKSDAVVYMIKLLSIDCPPMEKIDSSKLLRVLIQATISTSWNKSNTLLVQMVTCIYYILNMTIDQEVRVQETFNLNLLPKLVLFLRATGSDEVLSQLQGSAMNIINVMCFYDSKTVMSANALDAIIGISANRTGDTVVLFHSTKVINTLLKSDMALKVVTERRMEPLLDIFLAGIRQTHDNRITHFCCDALANMLLTEKRKGDDDSVISILFVILGLDHILVQLLDLVNSGSKGKTKQLETDTAAMLVAIIEVMPAEQIPTLLIFDRLVETLVSFLVPLKVGGSCQDKSLHACHALSLLVPWYQRVVAKVPTSQVRKKLDLLRYYRDYGASEALSGYAAEFLNVAESTLAAFAN